MNFKVSPPPSLLTVLEDGKKNKPQTSPAGLTVSEEWVEIIEPKSKTKIYANLESGVCAKHPPEGVTVLKAEDFDDHWWELYDKKTGKYYYYNPEQQKTVWTKPVAASPKNGSSNGCGTSRGKLLLIPVSKLQTFKRLSPVSEQQNHQQVSKCDASTQTIASNLVEVGTQTFSEVELSKRLNDIDLHSDEQQTYRQQPSPKSSKLTSNRVSSKIAEYQNAFKSHQADPINHRQISDSARRNLRAPFIKSSTISDVNEARTSLDEGNRITRKSKHFAQGNDEATKNSSQLGQVNNATLGNDVNQVLEGDSSKHDSSADEKHNVFKYFSPTPPPPSQVVSNQQKASELQRQQPLQPSNRRSMHIRDSVQSSSFRPGDTSNGTSSSNFRNLSSSAKSTPDTIVSSQRPKTIHEASGRQDQRQQPTQQVVTNNLSHYLVREARAMGIALISDDELDDDDQGSDDESEKDDDEDTDMRDDLSSNRDLGNDLDRSQDLGDDGSSECGWRSFSDQESPNARFHQTTNKSNAPSGGRDNKLQKLAKTESTKIAKSPISCETAPSPAFIYENSELIDDQKNPASCMSQQLDHRKLVENFKKTRQTSALGFNDSLGRSYRLDANNAVQRLKTVADTYFNNSNQSSGGNNTDQPAAKEKDIYKTSEKYLRHLSTLSTLPRPIKAKPPQVPPNADLEIDADYDVVEENCGFFSDSERIKAALGQDSTTVQLDTSKSSTISSNKTSAGEDIILSNNLENDSPVKSYFDRNKSTRGSTFSVESFARENLARHPKKGGLLFNRKVKWSRMISWTKSSIKQPMISSVSSDLNADSILAFKLIQQFMGDRKITMSKKYRQLLTQSGMTEQEISSMTSRKSLGRAGSLNNTSTSTTSLTPNNASSVAPIGSSTPVSGVATGVGGTSNYIPDRLRDELAFELACKGCLKSALRDEIFVQLARQLTENPSVDSTSWGLILMSILFNYFSPSNKFAPFLLSFLETHGHQMARDVCLPRLEKRLRQNSLCYCRKPADGKEISIVRLSITKWPQYCGVFGESLERIMALQACSPYLKTLRLPWILATLGDKLLETGGDEMEGIFRCAADHDLLAQLRLEIDCVDFRKITDSKQLKSLLSNVDDPHVIAGLLKLFFRQLAEPVFPWRIYDACLMSCHDASLACRLFEGRLPNLNKDVVAYLVSLLQLLSQQDKVINTKMDTANLSMVWAPNLLRAPDKTNNNFVNPESPIADSRSGSKWSISNGAGGDEQQLGGSMTGNGGHAHQPAQSQSMIFEQTRQEMQFIKLLITNLDTSFIKNVL